MSDRRVSGKPWIFRARSFRSGSRATGRYVTAENFRLPENVGTFNPIFPFNPIRFLFGRGRCFHFENFDVATCLIFIKSIQNILKNSSLVSTLVNIKFYNG